MADNIKNQESSETNYKDLNPDEPDFKSIRESRGLTLKDIYKSTRISITNLAAIENSDFHLLPPPVFTKSFIKIYAKAVGVESASALARYEQYLATLNNASRDVETKIIPKPARVNYRRLLWASCILIVAVSIIYSLSSYKSGIDILKDNTVEPPHKTSITNTADDSKTGIENHASDQTNLAIKTQDSTDQSTVETQVQRPTNVAESKPEIRQQEAATPQKIVSTQKEITEKYPMTMAARELTWVRITLDHDPPFEVLLKPGERIEKSASKFIIDIGNAGGIDIVFQGKAIGSLGKRGEVVHLNLP